ncbi:MAG: DUF1028 domain-containing protein [Nakamurella sp.]
MTFSIAARSADGAWWGVAVSSKVLAVGRAVPAAEVGIGAVATQAFCNLTFRERGLAALRAGASAPEAVQQLIDEDEMADVRQVGIVDKDGVSASHTGQNCIPWSGHATGPGYAIQGNLLSGPQVVAAMERAWLATDESDPIARRMVATLLAGDRAGGDRRGRQSAALLVVTENGAHEGGCDIYADLRVDDHLDPVVELSRLVDIQEVSLDKTHQAGSVPVSEAALRELAMMLDRVGFQPESADRPDVLAALKRWADDNYLARRLLDDAIDNELLYVLRRQSGETWRLTS